jgi:hypothetical protein
MVGSDAEQRDTCGGIAMKNRTAVTLTELLVTMSAGSALMMLAIGTLHQSMSLASAARQRSDHQRTLDRLARAFRHDVHRADQCSVGSPEHVEFSMPDDSAVTYDVSANRVTRQQRLQQGPDHRETFEFNAEALVTFERLDEPARAVLTIAGKLPSGGPARVDRQVSAVVGRLIKHERAEVSP